MPHPGFFQRNSAIVHPAARGALTRSSRSKTARLLGAAFHPRTSYSLNLDRPAHLETREKKKKKKCGSPAGIHFVLAVLVLPDRLRHRRSLRHSERRLRDWPGRIAITPSPPANIVPSSRCGTGLRQSVSTCGNAPPIPSAEKRPFHQDTALPPSNSALKSDPPTPRRSDYLRSQAGARSTITASIGLYAHGPLRNASTTARRPHLGTAQTLTTLTHWWTTPPSISRGLSSGHRPASAGLDDDVTVTAASVSSSRGP